MFAAEETGALQQEGLWEDQGSRERTAPGAGGCVGPRECHVASGAPVRGSISFSAKQ